MLKIEENKRTIIIRNCLPHSKHEELPIRDVSPCPQRSHLSNVEELSLRKNPAGQLRQPSPYLPGAHSIQTAAPGLLVYLPTEQTVQMDCLEFSANKLIAQSLHRTAPSILLLDPG